MQVLNRRVTAHIEGDWHETYLIKAGNDECIYNNMPPFGLARVASTLDAQGTHATSSGRLGKTGGSDAPILPDGTERA